MSCSLIPSEAWMWNYCAEYGNAQRPRRVFGCVIPGHCTNLHPRAQTDRIYRSTCDAAAQRCCVKTKPGHGLCIPPQVPSQSVFLPCLSLSPGAVQLPSFPNLSRTSDAHFVHECLHENFPHSLLPREAPCFAEEDLWAVHPMGGQELIS